MIPARNIRHLAASFDHGLKLLTALAMGFGLAPSARAADGSFPQTAEIRQARSRFMAGEIDERAYRQAMFKRGQTRYLKES
jgi:hypothetical protein